MSDQTASQGTAVSLTHAELFKGKVLSDEPGWKEHRGHCASGVQYVFYKAGKPLGRTPSWRQGVKVRGNNVPPGTAIASFRNGRYAEDHAAILIRETKSGLEVWDQYKNPPKAWGKRTLFFTDNNNDLSNNGNLFYVIIK